MVTFPQLARSVGRVSILESTCSRPSTTIIGRRLEYIHFFIIGNELLRLLVWAPSSLRISAYHVGALDHSGYLAILVTCLCRNRIKPWHRFPSTTTITNIISPAPAH